MRLIEKALLKECQLQLFALFILLLASAGILVSTFEESVILPVLGLLGLIISIHLIYQTVRLLKVEEHRLIWLLKNQPHAIVWVYSVKTERLPFGFQLSSSTTFYFKLADGDEMTISVSPEKLNLLSKYLNRLLPHATFGYSRDRAQWYQVHPDMLRKEREK